MNTKRTKLYWSLQMAGWVSYFGLCAGIMLLYNPKPIVLVVWFIIMLGHLGVSHFLRYLIRTRHWLDAKPGLLAVKLFGTCIILALAVNVLLAPVPPLFGLNSLAEQLRGFRMFVPYSLLLFCVWSMIYTAFQYFFRYRDGEMQRLRLEASVNAAELRAIKAQVNPHFLFNCLNNLRALIAEDGDKARTMLLHLSELLRYSLEAGRRDKVPLSEELHIVEGYLALEKLQFENRLRWSINISEAARDALIPPMLVQQLVENAIKHGVAQQTTGGEVSISAEARGGGIDLRVENTGALKPTETHKGFGIENVRERLRLLCGGGASFDLASSSEGRVAATAHIPLTANV